MGIAVSTISFGVTALSGELPGQWIITVTNTGSFTSSFIPLSVMVESEELQLEALEFTTEHKPHLQPGTSMQYLLKLKRIGFEQLDGWNPGELDRSENLTLILHHLGAGGSPALSIIPLVI